MPIPVPDLFKIPLIYGMDLAVSGKFLLYSSNASGIPHLYVLSTKPGSKPKQVTSGGDPVIFGSLSPDEDRLVYLRDEDGNELHHLFLMSRDGGVVRRITDEPLRTFGLDWHPTEPEVTRSCVTKERSLLQTFDLETGERYTLREQPEAITHIKYSHDGRWIACSVRGGGKDPRNQQIVVVNRRDPTETIVYDLKDGSKEMLASWSPDDRKLAFISDLKGRNQVVIQEFQGDDRLFLSLEEGEEVAEHEVGWSPKSDEVYYIVSKHSRTTLHEHPLDGGRGHALPFPKGTISMFKISEDGKIIVAVHSSMSSPPGIYMYEVGSESSIPLTPRDYGIELEELAQPRSVWYRSFDGLKIHGWYLPARSGAPPHPAVVWPHGGPWWQTFDMWSPYLQSMSQGGFAVLAPNFRGSTGYGADFQSMDISDPGGGDLEDVVYAAKWLHEQDEIDGSRIAVVGGSYGGFMTLMALTKKPGVFSAGVAIVPIADWLEMYNLSDSAFRGFMRELFGGSPKEKEELYRERSPVTHVSHIKAPVMIIAGRRDSRCPIEQVEKFVRKLKEMGHPHSFRVEEREGHGFLRVRDNIREATAAIEYLRKTLHVKCS